MLVALPALGVAAVMLLTTREPPRGGTEAALSVRSRRSHSSDDASYAWKTAI